MIHPLGDDLGAVGGVLVGHTGVGGVALVDEEPGQSLCGQRLGLIGSPSPSEDDRMPPPQILASWCWLVVVLTMAVLGVGEECFHGLSEIDHHSVWCGAGKRLPTE